MKIIIDQRKAEMDDPAQMAGWALSSIPPAPGSPPDTPSLVLPVLYLPVMSSHLHACGFRHHPELQTIHQEVDPRAALRSAGVRWVPGAPVWGEVA